MKILTLACITLAFLSGLAVSETGMNDAALVDPSRTSMSTPFAVSSTRMHASSDPASLAAAMQSLPHGRHCSRRSARC